MCPWSKKGHASEVFELPSLPIVPGDLNAKQILWLTFDEVGDR